MDNGYTAPGGVRVFVVATEAVFFETHMTPHVAMLRDVASKVTVLCSTKPKALPSGVDFEQVAFSREVHRFDLHVKAFRQMRALLATATRESPILCELHTPIASFICRSALPKASREHVRVVYMPHGLPFLQGSKSPTSFAERMMSKRTDHFIVMNEEDHEVVRSFGTEDVSVIPGVGSRRLRLLEADRASKEIAVVGVLKKLKRTELAIRSMSHLPEDVTMTIYGTGPLEDELRALCVELSLTDRIRFAGWVDELSHAYESAAALMFLSGREGLPMTIIEGLAAALPIVAFDVRGVRDVLHDLDSWFVPDSLEPEAVAAAASKAIAAKVDPVACHERVLEFSLERSLAAHRSIIEGIVDSIGRIPADS